MGRISVIGIGPGSARFLTPAAREAVEASDLLVGGKNALALFPGEKPRKRIDRNLEEVLEYLRKNREKRIALLTSGDPGFFSILRYVTEAFPAEEIEVIPGISSLQLCFSKIREMWHDCRILSVHGREMEDLVEEVRDHPKVALLTDPKNTPAEVARHLLEQGLKDRRVVVCDSLDLPGERVVESDLEGIARGEFSGHCVMVIFRER
jgi:precorrin-6y C5,15-methyltransferase (decarboxylating) CbiE subunit